MKTTRSSGCWRRSFDSILVAVVRGFQENILPIRYDRQVDLKPASGGHFCKVMEEGKISLVAMTLPATRVGIPTRARRRTAHAAWWLMKAALGSPRRKCPQKKTAYILRREASELAAMAAAAPHPTQHDIGRRKR